MCPQIQGKHYNSIIYTTQQSVVGTLYVYFNFISGTWDYWNYWIINLHDLQYCETYIIYVFYKNFHFSVYLFFVDTWCTYIIFSALIFHTEQLTGS